MSNDRASCGAGVAGFDGFAGADADTESVAADCRRMRMIGEAACEGIMVHYVSFKIRVDICGPKPFIDHKLRRATATDTIFPEGFYCTHFDNFVTSEAREVVAGKIENLLARVGEFRPEPICIRDHGYSLGLLRARGPQTSDAACPED
ncbi:hypothetical protein EDB85DRAFT_2277608 [Lactarius pseudohatsudake]|nr:hypothetical protein EDB85DRAFT_2277608 [Lactarius pseudohatsudake]